MAQASNELKSVRLAYKKDQFGADIFARVTWQQSSATETSLCRPTVLIFHAGDFVMGSSEDIPAAQVGHLCSRGFVAVLPNYRLAPQVTGVTALADAEDAYEWSVSILPQLLDQLLDGQSTPKLHANRISALGYGAGGTIALHLAACKKPLRAVATFYPFLFASEGGPPEPNDALDMGFTSEEWLSIWPRDRQVSEASLLFDGSPRAAWVANLFTRGTWLSTVQPDGNYPAIDPLTRTHNAWPPTMFVQGDQARDPTHCSIEAVHRAQNRLSEVRQNLAEVVHVPRAGNLFDHVLTVDAADMGTKWSLIANTLDWLELNSRE